MGYIIIHRTKKKKKDRVRLKNGTLTPYLQYPQQAVNYIQKYLGNQGYFDIIKVGK